MLYGALWGIAGLFFIQSGLETKRVRYSEGGWRSVCCPNHSKSEHLKCWDRMKYLWLAKTNFYPKKNYCLFIKRSRLTVNFFVLSQPIENGTK